MLLESLGCTDITYRNNKNELRFSREEGHNPSAMRLKLDTLKFDGFSINLHGNIYTLVMKYKELSFANSLKYIVKTLNLSDRFNDSVKIKKPFSNFYKGFVRQSNNLEYSIKTYDESILEPFLNKCNKMFFNDGIDYLTQQHFKDGFDIETLRITVPQYTLNGDLCGIMGRLNDLDCPKDIRWLPIIPCSRSLTLYGYHFNYEAIQQKRTVIIGESEKFVQQMYAMGSQVGLATCGCDISNTQAKHIKALMIPRTIVAYDEGLDEDQIRSQAEKLVLKNSIFQNKVGYIFDKEHLFLPRDSKASPTDYGKKIFQSLLQQCVIWIN